MSVNLLNRAGAEALIPEEVTSNIIQGVIKESATLSVFRKLPNMASNVQSMPVLDMLPMAYWVNGDTGAKKTTKMAWDKKKIYAEEVAVIVPIPEAVLNDAADSGYDIWAEVQPRIIEAFGRVIDDATLFNINKPTSWREGIVETAKRADSYVNATSDFYADVFGEGGVIGKVEESGFLPNGVISAVTMRGKLRGMVDGNKRPLFADNKTLDGMPIFFLENGAWNAVDATLIVGDMSQAVFSIRQDITYKLLTEGVIQDESGDIIYNLAQQDMVALRVVMRLGWEIPNPINALKPDGAERCPFAVYLPSTSVQPAANVFVIASAAGTASGNTKITVTGANATGALLYKTGASLALPKLNAATTGYTAWDGLADITATTGHDIVVVQADALGKVENAGKTVVVSKA